MQAAKMLASENQVGGLLEQGGSPEGPPSSDVICVGGGQVQ